MGFDKISEAGENVLRRFRWIDTFDVSNGKRGSFSAGLLENAWNRMFWMRVYSERVKLKASDSDKNLAWDKYITSSETWSSGIMNYYLGLEEYYPDSNKRAVLQETIQPKFLNIARKLAFLKYNEQHVSDSTRTALVKEIQTLVDNVNEDFYFLISREDLKD